MRRGFPSVVIVLLLALLGGRLAHDERRHQAVLRAADAVAVDLIVNDWGTGVGGSAVVSVHVSGRGDEVRVDAPLLRPDVAARIEIVGAPLVVAADTGNQIRVRLQPDCRRVLGVDQLHLEVPVTPSSGRRHVLRVAFPQGPVLLRRACGFLPVEEALTTTTYYPLWSGERLQLHVGVRNDGRQPLQLVGLNAVGMRLQIRLPVDLPARGATEDLPLVLQVLDCAAAGQVDALTAQLVDTAGKQHQVSLPIGEPNSVTFRWFVAHRCTPGGYRAARSASRSTPVGGSSSGGR